MNTVNRDLKTTFAKVSALYAEARPDYPTELIERIIQFSGIAPGGRILDIGCGNGQASLPFAERGHEVLGIDISAEQIAIAKEKAAGIPNIRYQVGSFEEMDLGENSWDLIISAQAFHWVDPKIGYPKAYRLLKQDGTFALFWNLTDYEHGAAFLPEIKRLSKKYCPDRPKQFTTTAGLTRFSPFEKHLEESFFHSVDYTKTRYLKLLHTMSWVSSLPEETKKAFFDEVKRVLKNEREPLTLSYRTELILAKK